MTTETLTGRQLDAEVARVLGYKADDWKWLQKTRGERCKACNRLPDIAYSAPDCSGLAPVLAWLDANRPAEERELLVDGSLSFNDTRDGWEAGYNGVLFADAPTLPEAACRLLVAWAAKREGGS